MFSVIVFHSCANRLYSRWGKWWAGAWRGKYNCAGGLYQNAAFGHPSLPSGQLQAGGCVEKWGKGRGEWPALSRKHRRNPPPPRPTSKVSPRATVALSAPAVLDVALHPFFIYALDVWLRRVFGEGRGWGGNNPTGTTYVLLIKSFAHWANRVSRNGEMGILTLFQANTNGKTTGYTNR